MTANKTPVQFELQNPRLLKTAAIALLSYVGLLHFFILYVVFPSIEFGSFIMNIPSKVRRTLYYVNENEFLTTSLIAISITLAAVIWVFALIKKGKGANAFYIVLFFATALALYGAVLLGNGFHELWRGGGWSVLGVAIAIAISVAIQVCAYRSLKKVPMGTPPSR